MGPAGSSMVAAADLADFRQVVRGCPDGRVSTRIEGAAVIRYTVLYPKTEGATFDHEYYRTSHIPMIASMMGVTDVEIDRAVDGPYLAAAHIRFDSLEAMRTALARLDGPTVGADIANYTNATPQMQISEIVA